MAQECCTSRTVKIVNGDDSELILDGGQLKIVPANGDPIIIGGDSVISVPDPPRIDDAVSTEDIVSKFNTLLAHLRTIGVITTMMFYCLLRWFH